MKDFKTKLNLIIESKTFTLVVSYLGLFLLVTGISLGVFSLLFKGSSSGGNTTTGTGKSKINLNMPKTATCPINGMKYTKAEEDIWNKRRPVLAMIENHLDSRPQSGQSKADVIYEAVAEGGITRFLNVFYCGAAAEDVKVAPIRSARIYYVNLAAGYGLNPIYLHQGGANNFCSTCPGGVKLKGDIDKTVDAYAALDKLGWRNGQYGNDFDGGFNIGVPVIVRNQYRVSNEPAAWEHSVVASMDEVYNEAAKREYNFKDGDGVAWNKNFKMWKFMDDKASSNPTAVDISFEFWKNKPDYDVAWKYDAATNSYKRSNGGKPAIDWEFDKPQLTAKNVVIMFAKEKGPVDKELHMYYEVIGKGNAMIFQNGEVIEGTWSKASQLDREVFYDKNGKEINFVRGQIWIEIIPEGNTIKY